MAFGSMGCRVEVACPREHPAARVRAVHRVHPYPGARPLGTLRAAIQRAAPDLVIPCDDAAAVQLHQLQLQAAAAGPAGCDLGPLIARSLGAPEACVLATERGRFLALADSLGIRSPKATVLAAPCDLEAWLRHHPLPAVLKIDSSWGGQGVAIVRTAEEARRAFGRMRRRPSPLDATVRLLLDRDATPLLGTLAVADRTVTMQAFIAGTPANRAVACWQGRVLAGTSVEAIRTLHPTGPATVVRVIDQPEMSAAVDMLVQRLGVSGLWGFDFVLEAATGAPYLIEANPRATPICHLPFAAASNLPAALYAQLAGRRPPTAIAVLDQEVIALFPGEWRRDPASVFLRSRYHDVPWEEPALVQDCIDPPWSERGAIARLWAHVRPRRSSHPNPSSLRTIPGAASSRVECGGPPLGADSTD
jgi:hypothetical protein